MGEPAETVVVVAGGQRDVLSYAGAPLVALAPLNELPVPQELGGGKLAVPNLLEVLDHCERERYAEIVVDGASPHALAGLFAGKILGLRTCGLFDSDLPVRLRAATGSETLENLAWRYLRWFFGSLDLTYVASRRERQALVARGFDPRRLRLLAPAHEAAPALSEDDRAFLLELRA